MVFSSNNWMSLFSWFECITAPISRAAFCVGCIGLVGTSLLIRFEGPKFYDVFVSVCPGFQVGETLSSVTMLRMIKRLL